MRRVIVYSIFLFFALCMKAQTPYSLVGSTYQFQHSQNEIKWNYLLRAFYNDFISPEYLTKISADFYTKNDVLLFNISGECNYNTYENHVYDTVGDCYSDTVKMVIKISFWNAESVTCTGTPLAECSKTVILENPLIYDSYELCRENIEDTLFCTTPENDSISISFRIERFADLYINSYGESSFHNNNKIVYPIDNFCIGDSVAINFRTNESSTYKLYKQYNDNEPELISIGDIFMQQHLSGQVDSLCSHYHYGYRNYFSYRSTADTIYDPLFEDNNKYTKITYYLSVQSECGSEDSFYTISHPIYVYKPLRFVPYTLYHDCTNDASGSVSFDMSEKYGGYIVHNYLRSGYFTDESWTTMFCDSSFLSYLDKLNYVLYRDNIFNETYDELCYDLYGQGELLDHSNEINNLAEGDYKIILTPSKIGCDVFHDEGYSLTEHPNWLCCTGKENCIGEPISFTFTIKKFNHAKPLGPDRILCQDSTVVLSIPQSYTEDGNTAIWGTAYCGISSEVIGKPYEHTVEYKGGGYHTIKITTTESCLIKDTVIVADLTPNNLNYSLPTALSTNAIQHSSGWSSQYNTIQWEDADLLEYFSESNLYFNGSAGVYRPEKSNDYADTLNSSAGLFAAYGSTTPASQINEVKIRNTGNIMDYKLFNYGNPLFTACVPEWVLNNSMTKYSPSGYDIENKDILKIFSSALYAYRDKLPIAVCSNARMDEIGFESFEEYSNSSGDENYFNSKTQLNNSTGNIDIIRQTEEIFMPKNKDYEIIRGFNRYAMVKGNICSACENPFVCTVSAQSVPYDFTTEKITDKNVVSYTTKVMASPCGDSSYTILQLDENLPSDQTAFRCRFWAGKVSVQSKKYIPSLGTFNVELDNTVSHSGNYSLKMPSNQRVILPQPDLELEPKKPYHIGLWMHKGSMEVESPESLKYSNASDSIGVLVILPNNEKIFLTPMGEVIEGWQRLEGSFTMPAGMRTEIRLGFVGKVSYNIDDIRIYPKNSSIQTYVYDPNNYKVRAVLDQNNYATIYQYDDEGNLFTIKKETAKGIKTIQVSGSHLKSSK